MNNEFIEAAKTGDIDKVKLLLTNPKVNPTVKDNQAIRLASLNGHLEVVRLLLNDPRVDPAAGNSYAIRRASANGYTEVVRLLLNDPRVDPAAENNEAIQLASLNGYLEVVRLLLNDPRVDPAAINNYVIRVASRDGYLEVVRLLLNDPRVDPAAENNLAIRWASRNGRTEVVRLLLTDPRVDWRLASSDVKDDLIKQQSNQLKSELTTSYLSLERTSPQIRFDDKIKSAVPKEILKQTVYAGPYEELCMVIKNSEIPPVKLAALAKILNINYDEKIEWSKLCDKVKHAIFVSLYLHN